MTLRLSLFRRLFASNPVQSFHPNSAMLQLNPATKDTPRPFAGLDMQKMYSFKFENTWNPSMKFPKSGYQGQVFGMPSVDAMNDREIAAFFDTDNYYKRHSFKQLWHYAKHPFAFIGIFQSVVVICLLPFIAFVLYLQAWEPMEKHIDSEEYYRDFFWHYNGPHLDHHAYEQYLEARRAVKWRNADINPRDWIPEKYRDLQ
ncbi:hypothetical protein IE077_002520 [Cardiosporidium cionae]|uniref:Uncharacterized protein n=1 Tax=Cardiosporidium cionae TaxID=476202 RepID=A0ABQ7J4K4_9APIC|nr:hypothetical protein IE077_002520 [Cardiosporidium cionae]|eukprot:KAF8817961.1 hypothetical protein IE077_002520 [Cardiosporidium cionae]